MMDKELLLNVLQVAGTAAIGAVSFLIRSYLKGFERELTQIGRHLSSLKDDLAINTIETTKVTTELKHVWRFIDYRRTQANEDRAEL